ncbi:MAG: non-homologous end-joining DNA ligase LigD [Candidatus Thorarchaeota archaeon]|jgi:DNA primase catalytic subunit
MNPRQVGEYYSREDILKAIIEFSEERETAGVFRNGSFGQRPNVLVYPQDILAMVKSGVVEFHTSLERWSNPMALKQENYNELRVGWDLILDIDCKVFDHAKIAALALSEALKRHGISGFSVKYTGGKGFHIGIPWEAIPKTINFKNVARLYPDIARQAGLYLKDFIREDLSRKLLKKQSAEKVSEETGVSLGKILTDTGIDPFAFIEIDPVLISPRHLFRAPYSLNKKSFLVSLPIKPTQIEGFEKEMSRPEKIKADLKFLSSSEPDEAGLLFAETADWYSKVKSRRKKILEREFKLTQKITPELFPPCINHISNGLEDGRKRSVLILINFLSNLKWTRAETEDFVLKWNLKNKPPLQDNYIRSQLRWHRNRNKSILPPNCSNPAYYKGFGVCTPDDLCKLVNNPVGYPIRKLPKPSKGRRKPARKSPKKRSG